MERPNTQRRAPWPLLRGDEYCRQPVGSAQCPLLSLKVCTLKKQEHGSLESSDSKEKWYWRRGAARFFFFFCLERSFSRTILTVCNVLPSISWVRLWECPRHHWERPTHDWECPGTPKSIQIDTYDRGYSETVHAQYRTPYEVWTLASSHVWQNRRSVSGAMPFSYE